MAKNPQRWPSSLQGYSAVAFASSISRCRWSRRRRRFSCRRCSRRPRRSRWRKISSYDERGPAWYWNNIACGEHTGTHFDAPIHWVTGKDYPNNATHNIPVQKFIGPACVIDVADRVRENADFLVTVDVVKAWEASMARSARRVGADPHRLVEAHRRRALPQYPRGRAAYAGLSSAVRALPGEGARHSRVGVETVGTDAGQAATFDPMFPCHTIMHGSNRFGLASLMNLDQLPATGAIVIAPPLKIVNGSGSPLRVLALVPGLNWAHDETMRRIHHPGAAKMRASAELKSSGSGLPMPASASRSSPRD